MSVKLFGGNKFLSLKQWTFPGGERNVRVENTNEAFRAGPLTVYCDFRSSDDLIDVMLLVNAVKNIDKSIRVRLSIPYMPFARQDRVMIEGEPLALQVAASIIGSCGFTEVEVWDAHSDVLAGMFSPGTLKIKSQADCLEPLIRIDSQYPNYALISPDAGALKKVYKLAHALGCSTVFEASKQRDPRTGEIIGTKLDAEDFCRYDEIYVVDDICDGGRTFVELGKVIRETYSGRLVLCVTHGIFSKGLEVFDGIYDCVLCANDMRGE